VQAERVKIIRGNDAADSLFGAVADAERGAADVLGEEGGDLTALSLDRAREAASILRAPDQDQG